MVRAHRLSRWESCLKDAGLVLAFAGVAGVVMAGCSSARDAEYDRLAAQTSRPGWVVGDSLGQMIAPPRLSAVASAQVRGERSRVSTASVRE